MGWRGDVRDSFKTALDAFLLANPTLVDHVYKSRPPSLVDSRSVFIGGIDEAIRHDFQTRQRTADVTLVCVAQLGENAEVMDDCEDLADALVDYLSTNYGLTGTLTVQEPIRTTTTEISEGGTFLPAIAVVSRALIQQGRT